MILETWYMILLEFFLKQLLFLASAAYTLPVIIGCAIPFCGTESHRIEPSTFKKLTFMSLLLSCLGIFTAFNDPVLLYTNMYLQGINPRFPNLFENGILAYTTCALCHCAGTITLIIFYFKLPSTLANEYNKKFPKIFVIFLIISSIIFFISMILQTWPFAGYPEGINYLYLLSLLGQQSLHRYIESFVSAGICTLAFSWYLCNKIQVQSSSKDRNFQIQVERFCYVTCIIGLVPQSLMALGNIVKALLHQNILHQQILSLCESCFLLCSLVCFIILLFPRFSKWRTWRYLAIGVYFTVWNWKIVAAVLQQLITK